MDVVENAAWLTGRESEAQLKDLTRQICMGIEDICQDRRVTHGPYRIYELRPGDERVPPVPDWLRGDAVLLVIEADVTGRTPGWSQDLDDPSLDAMRNATRYAYAAVYPGQHLSDDQCDDIIDEVGELTIKNIVRKRLDS